MESHTMELVGGGILAVMILKEVFSFLKSKTQNGHKPKWAYQFEIRLNDFEKTRDKAVRLIEDLHEWHAPNEDGEQPWKNKHMIELMDKMCQAIDNNTKTLDRLVPVLQRLERRHEDD